MEFERKAVSDRTHSLVLSSGLIERDVLAREAALNTTKWFAYRFMSPMVATLHFLKCYREALKRYVRQNIDVDLSEAVMGARVNTKSGPNKEFTQLWVARQRADQYCLPYELYLEFCFHFAARRKRRTSPRPNQLHPTHTSKQAWEAGFAAFRADRRGQIFRRLLRDWPYTVASSKDFPPQVAMREFVLAEVPVVGASWDWVIAEYCLRREIVPLEQISTIMKPEVFAKSLKGANEIAVPFDSDETSPDERSSSRSALPSCFGILTSIDQPGAACSVCTLRRACDVMARSVVDRLKQTTGSDDPLLERRRKMGRGRTQLCRTKKREGAASVRAA